MAAKRRSARAGRSATAGTRGGDGRLGTAAHRAFLAALLAYLAVLVLGGWPREVRPAFLDRPHHAALVALWVAGIRPGIEVFQESNPDEHKFRAHCIHADARAPGVAPIALYPPDGRCRTGGLRLRMPPFEIGLYRALRQAWELRRGAGATGTVASDRVLERVGRYFCGRSELAGRPGMQVALTWYSYVESYVTAAQLRGGFVYYGWDCDAARFTAKSWRRDDEPLARFDAAIVRFWGGEPWR